MASYKILFHREAEKELKKLHKLEIPRILKLIDQIAKNPYLPQTKKLTGSDDHFRVRSGQYRVIYRIGDKELVILIIKIAHRKEVYR